MKIRLVAVDLDGTLLNSAKEISTVTANTIGTARKIGDIRIVLATARPPRTVLPFYSQLKLDTPIINYNGALVHDPTNGRIILHRPMEAKLARAVTMIARNMYPDILVSAEVLDNWYTDHMEDRWYSETSKLNRPYIVAPMNEWLNQPITRLLLLGPKDWLVDIRQSVQSTIPNQTGMAWSENFMLQIMHPAAGKAAALRAVASDMHIPSEETMAIGDNANDAGMIQWAGVGVAMGNAPQRIRDFSDYVTDSNDANGVAKALDKFIITPIISNEGPHL
ncbi:MAG: HAD family phosphatase [bacterium]|nr:HAD family phosphatase [bacterium]